MNVIKMCYTAHNRRSYWSVRYDSLELHISKIKIVNKRFYSHLLSKSIREKTSAASHLLLYVVKGGGLLLCVVRHQRWDSKARNNLSLSKMQWWITVFQITNKSINSSCEVVMVASQNILCFLPTEKRPWEDQTELENWSPVSSAWRSNTKW